MLVTIFTLSHATSHLLFQVQTVYKCSEMTFVCLTWNKHLMTLYMNMMKSDRAIEGNTWATMQKRVLDVYHTLTHTVQHDVSLTAMNIVTCFHSFIIRFIELREERVVPAARRSVHPRLTHVLCLSGVVDGRSFCSSWHTHVHHSHSRRYANHMSVFSWSYSSTAFILLQWIQQTYWK